MSEEMIIAVAKLWFSNNYSPADIAAILDLDRAAVARITDMLLHLSRDVLNPILKERLSDVIDDVL